MKKYRKPSGNGGPCNTNPITANNAPAIITRYKPETSGLRAENLYLDKLYKIHF